MSQPDVATERRTSAGAGGPEPRALPGGDRLTLALAYDIGTENAVELSGNPRTFWTGSALFVRWHVPAPGSLAVRPEFYWDRNGRLTGSEQLLTAITSTVEYKLSYGNHSVLTRLEYRHDESTGSGGGFFRQSAIGTGGSGLAREQHLLILGILWAFDS